MNDIRDNLIQGQQQNAASVGTKFRTQRFLLDEARDRFTYGVTDHTFGSGIKSFWVSDTNNRNFIASIVPNFKGDRQKESGLPLRFNMNQKFAAPVNDACVEFPAQAGVWIEITYSESEDISIGNNEISLSGAVTISEGSLFDSNKITLPVSTVTEIFPANGSRTVCTIQLKSGGSFYIGTLAKLNDADFSNKCLEVILTPGQSFTWKNAGGLLAKPSSLTTPVVLCVLEETK